MPLKMLLATADTVGRLIPLIVLVPLVPVPVRDTFIPLVTAVPAVEELVRAIFVAESLLVEVEYVSVVFPLVNIKLPLVNVALPAVKVRFFPVAIVVSPLSAIAPVPVPNVPVPEIAKLPLLCVYPVMFWRAPALVSLDVPPVKSSPSARFKLATLLPLLFRRVRVEVDA